MTQGTTHEATKPGKFVRAIATKMGDVGRRGVAYGRAYFRDQDPTFATAFGAALVVAAVLFVRSPTTNYIFDEQEALLANPYVNGHALPFKDVLKRDFWGLPSDRSIGSYRPLPNVIWRLIWHAHTAFQHPWVHHAVNVLIHAINAALVAVLAFAWTRSRSIAWLSGAVFVTCALVTEAITGVVGLADVLGGMGLLLGLMALRLRLVPMAIAAFLGLTIGFFSKESTLVGLPILFWAALVTAPIHHPERPRRILRAIVALVAATAALVLYTEVRRRFFPVTLPPELAEPLAAGAPWWQHAFHAFLRWFAQPRLPQDPINNPLVDADTYHRVAGALGVYAKGLSQIWFPWTLSGDYSYAEEPIPKHLVSVWSVLGGAMLVLPVVIGVGLWLWTIVAERRERAGGSFDGGSPPLRNLAVCSLAAIWIPIAYFPHSNIPVLLPTVRAERFWYVPAIAAAFFTGVVLARFAAVTRLKGRAGLGVAMVAAFLGFQAVRSRMHALDYTDDLMFWRATARAAPDSAKAHLNYGVMLGARGRLEERLVENGIALKIAPKWPMANVYYADTLCRLKRVDESWPHYKRGFVLSPNDRNLIALGLQCLWDNNATKIHRQEFLDLASKSPGSWLAYLARDMVYNGEKFHGVDPKYRPRGYDEGPKEH